MCIDLANEEDWLEKLFMIVQIIKKEKKLYEKSSFGG
jgi:hypothetical protein